MLGTKRPRDKSNSPGNEPKRPRHTLFSAFGTESQAYYEKNQMASVLESFQNQMRPGIFKTFINEETRIQP